MRMRVSARGAVTRAPWPAGPAIPGARAPGGRPYPDVPKPHARTYAHLRTCRLGTRARTYVRVRARTYVPLVRVSACMDLAARVRSHSIVRPILRSFFDVCTDLERATATC